MYVTYSTVLVFCPGETVISTRKKMHGLKIFHRYHFSSVLKRMSVIAGHTPPGSTETEYIATVKGAPETIKAMVNSWYNIQRWKMETKN